MRSDSLTACVLIGFLLCFAVTALAGGDDTGLVPRPDQDVSEPTPQPSFFERLFGARRQAPPAVKVELGKRHLVIVCGLTGGDEFRERFTQTTITLVDVLTSRGGFDKQLVQVYLGDEEMAADPDLNPLVTGNATQESLHQLADSLVETIEPADTLWLLVIGHTYFDGRRIWINLPGDDVNEQTFGQWFSPIGGRESVFWLTMPTSGFFIKPLSQPGRIVISATEADREVIATEFPHLLADVLANPPAEADQDGDGRLSLLDLYLLTTRRVAESFQERELIATEHARLDDNGDRRGSEVQRHYLPEELEGRLAEGAAPRPRRGDVDGVFAATVLLPAGLLTPPVLAEDVQSTDGTGGDADEATQSPDQEGTNDSTLSPSPTSEN